MVLAGLTDEEIRSALPERAEAYIIFANYLEKTGKDENGLGYLHVGPLYAGSEKQRTAASFFAA